MAELLKSAYGALVGPGSKFRVVAQIWKNRDTGGGYDLFLRRYVEVQAGTSGFGGTNLITSWGNVSISGSGKYLVVDTQLGVKGYGSTYSLGSGSIKAYYTGGSGTTYSSSTNISYTVPKPTYTISYDANGGSGAPSKQTKTYGADIELSTEMPTRIGYTFEGWATSSDGSVEYSSGDTYSANASVTLYAVWKVITYTVSYNANGGYGEPASQTKTYDVSLKLSSVIPTLRGYKFLGWATSKSAENPEYNAGSTYTNNASVTLYAIWKQDGSMYLSVDGQIKKGRAWIFQNGQKRYGIPWINVNGTWKKGGA